MIIPSIANKPDRHQFSNTRRQSLMKSASLPRRPTYTLIAIESMILQNDDAIQVRNTAS